MDIELSPEYMLSDKSKVQTKAKYVVYLLKGKKNRTHMNTCLHVVNVFEHGHKNLLAPGEGNSFARRSI